MNSHGLTKENLIVTLPMALQKDESVLALADAIADVLSQRPAEIDRLRIYPAIDQLDEPLLDILARDFKVDWWDPNYSLEEKRRTLKDSWRIHKVLGTKAAVQMAISAIYPSTKVLEWFEYNGQPYHFQLDINISDDSVDSERMRRVLARLNYYKSLRSHNDGIRYFMEPPEPATVRAVTFCPGLIGAMESTVPVLPLVVPHGDFELIAGMALALTIEKLPVDLELGGTVPTLEATTQFNACVGGSESGMSAPVILNMAREPPKSWDEMQVRTATPGMKVCMVSEMEATPEAPRAAVAGGTALRSCGSIMGMAVAVAAREPEYPGGAAAAHRAVRPAGVYQKIVMEVSKDDPLG